MWFEGDTTADKMPELLKSILEQATDETGQPMWRFVSSNIGTSPTDDGYVFYSKGSSGKDNLYIGFKNAYESGATSWHLGHRYFVTDSYQPSSTASQNGTFGDTLTDGFRYHENSTTTGVTKENHYLRYGINVNKDRVIIAICNAFIGPSRVRNVLYLGLIKRYSNEIDSSAMTVVSLYTKSTTDNNSPSSVRMLRDGAQRNGGTYEVLNVNHQPTNAQRGWGKRFIANPILLSTSMEGVRGEMDGLLQVFYSGGTGSTGPNVPLEGDVVINGQPYLCLVRISSSLADNLAPAAKSHAYFIPKV
jgi:hypothetical protein